MKIEHTYLGVPMSIEWEQKDSGYSFYIEGVDITNVIAEDTQDEIIEDAADKITQEEESTRLDYLYNCSDEEAIFRFKYLSGV